MYKTFYTVAKYNSFSKAAEKMYITQPTISYAIKQLESNLDTKLFYRSPNGVKLTPDGHEMFRYVERSYNLLVSGERNLKESKEFEYGEVSVGVQSHLGQFFLFPFVEEFHKEYPNIKINIICRNTEEMIKFLENNTIDFRIDTSPIDSIYNNLKIIPLLKLENCFISKNKISDEKISLSQISKFNLVLPVKRSTPRKELNRICEKKGVELNPFMTIETTEMLVNAVKKDIGIGYVIKQAVSEDLKNKQLYEVEVKEALPTIQLNLVYIDEYVTHIPKSFMDIILRKYAK